MSNSNSEYNFTNEYNTKFLRSTSLFRDPKFSLNLTRANIKHGSIPYDRTLKKEKILQNPSIKTMGRVSDKTTAIDYKGLPDLIIHPASRFDPETGSLRIIIQNVGDAPADGYYQTSLCFSHVTFDEIDSEDSIIQYAVAGDKYDLLIDGEIKPLYVKKDRDYGLSILMYDADGNFIFEKNSGTIEDASFSWLTMSGYHINFIYIDKVLQPGEWYALPAITGSFQEGEHILVHVDDMPFWRQLDRRDFINKSDNIEKIDNDDIPSNNYFLFKYENRQPYTDIKKNVSNTWTMNSYVNHPPDVNHENLDYSPDVERFSIKFKYNYDVSNKIPHDINHYTFAPLDYNYRGQTIEFSYVDSDDNKLFSINGTLEDTIYDNANPPRDPKRSNLLLWKDIRYWYTISVLTNESIFYLKEHPTLTVFDNNYSGITLESSNGSEIKTTDLSQYNEEGKHWDIIITRT